MFVLYALSSGTRPAVPSAQLTGAPQMNDDIGPVPAPGGAGGSDAAVTAAPEPEPSHPGETHVGGLSSRLNWLRAGVLGANDGIVSVAGLVVGVAGATSERGPIFTAGIAGLTAGAVSMALGEYVSVSSQRDSELGQLAAERRELRDDPGGELAELTAIYQAKGLSPATARTVAEELTAHDALAAHIDAELNLDPDQLTSPIHAAAASALSFFIGTVLPLIAILLAPQAWRVPATVLVVLIALGLTGWISARIGGGQARRAVLRVLVGGAAGLALTYAIGHLFGAIVS